MNPTMLPNHCHDCDAITSGRCWRHASVTLPTGETVLMGQVTIFGATPQGNRFDCFTCGHRWEGKPALSPRCPKCESFSVGVDFPEDAIEAAKEHRKDPFPDPGFGSGERP